MDSIIQELQSDAANSGHSISELLRKAKIVATKLELDEFLAWINKELNGYQTKNCDEIPSYRFVKGKPKGWNPFRGWIPLMFGDSNSQELMSNMPVNQSIGELEDLCNSNSNNLQMPYGPEAQRQIADAVNFQTEFTLIISKSAIVGKLM